MSQYFPSPTAAAGLSVIVKRELVLCGPLSECFFPSNGLQLSSHLYSAKPPLECKLAQFLTLPTNWHTTQLFELLSRCTLRDVLPAAALFISWSRAWGQPEAVWGILGCLG